MRTEEAKMVAHYLYQEGATKPRDERYLTAREAAAYLGISRSHLYHNIQDIPHHRRGLKGDLRFLRSELDHFFTT